MMVMLLPFVLPGCHTEDDGAAFWENEREIIALNQRLELCEYHLALSGPEGARELADLKSRISENEAVQDRLLASKTELAADIACMETRNLELGRIVLEQKRSIALGMKFETFSVKDGRTFENAVVTMVEDSGVDIRHEHGAARLRYGELSEQQRLFFGLEESASLAAEDRERKEALAFERDIESQMEAIRVNGIQADAMDGINNSLRFFRPLSPVSPRKSWTSVLSEPARPFGNAWSYQAYRSPYIYRSHKPVYRYVYRQVPACARICDTRTGFCATYKKIP